MPVLLRIGGVRFFFYANEGNPREPPHVHAEQGEAEAKVWLRPIQVAYNDGFDAKALRRIKAQIEANRDMMERVWDDFFRG